MKELLLGLFSFLKSDMSGYLVSKFRIVRKYLTGESVLTGGILGGLAGLLVAAAPVVLPGIGFLVRSPFVIFIGFVVGLVTGGILGALVDFGASYKTTRNRSKGKML